jgi:hypothetical protein
MPSRLAGDLLLARQGLGAGVALGPPAGAAKVEIKLATSIPANTPFTKLLDDLNKEWQTITGGDVSMVVYAGGVQGDESDALRKISIGQLHAGAITVASLSDIDDYFSVFQIPLFFDSWDELNYVLDDVTPLLAERLEQKGFVLPPGATSAGSTSSPRRRWRASTTCASSRSSPGPATTAWCSGGSETGSTRCYTVPDVSRARPE